MHMKNTTVTAKPRRTPATRDQDAKGRTKGRCLVCNLSLGTTLNDYCWTHEPH